MTFFFLVVGLEAKRELDLGELRERRRLAIPAFAAIGGMAAAGRDLPGVQRRRRRRARLGRRDVDRHRVRARRARAADAAPGDAPARLPAHARGRRRPRRAARDRHRLHRRRSRSARSPSRSALFAVLLALRYAPLAWRRPIVGRRSRVGRLGGDVRVRHRPGHRRASRSGSSTSAYPPARDDLERVDRAGARRSASSRRPSSRARRSAASPSAISPNERLQYAPAPVDELRDRAAVRARQRGHPHRRRPAVRRRHARRSRSASSSATWSASRSASSARSWIASRPALNGPRSPLSWPVLLARRRRRRHRLHGLAADRDASPSAGRRSTRRSSASSARSSSRRSSPGLILRVIRLHARRGARPAARAAPPTTLIDLADDVDPERDHIRGPAGRPRDAARVRRLRVPVLRPGGAGRSASCSTSLGDDVRYVWRHLPLNDVHPNAQLAAEATEAAAAQGRFWEMHDVLLDHQGELRLEDVIGYAERARARRRALRRRPAPARARRTRQRGRRERRRERRLRHADLLHQRPPPLRRLRHRDADRRRALGAQPRATGGQRLSAPRPSDTRRQPRSAICTTPPSGQATRIRPGARATAIPRPSPAVVVPSCCAPVRSAAATVHDGLPRSWDERRVDDDDVARGGRNRDGVEAAEADGRDRARRRPRAAARETCWRGRRRPGSCLKT